jgi:hypothetical protein
MVIFASKDFMDGGKWGNRCNRTLGGINDNSIIPNLNIKILQCTMDEYDSI